MCLGRIILITDGEQHSVIREKWLTKIFVVGDVISFPMQGAGESTTNGSRSKLGTDFAKAAASWRLEASIP